MPWCFHCLSATRWMNSWSHIQFGLGGAGEFPFVSSNLVFYFKDIKMFSCQLTLKTYENYSFFLLHCFSSSFLFSTIWTISPSTVCHRWKHFSPQWCLKSLPSFSWEKQGELAPRLCQIPQRLLGATVRLSGAWHVVLLRGNVYGCNPRLTWENLRALRAPCWILAWCHDEHRKSLGP